MTQTDLSPTIKRRLKYAENCPLCNKKVSDLEDFQILAFQYGRNRRYVFFHTKCLIKKGEEND